MWAVAGEVGAEGEEGGVAGWTIWWWGRWLVVLRELGNVMGVWGPAYHLQRVASRREYLGYREPCWAVVVVLVVWKDCFVDKTRLR